MALPFATTRISILRLTEDSLNGEPYDDEVRTVFLTNIRAVISQSPQNRGSEVTKGGERATVKARLSCDPCDLRNTDKIVDLVTEEVWSVEQVMKRTGFGLDHMAAGLFRTSGRL